MNITKWVKRRMALLSLAMAGVEKNALSQKGDTLDKTISQERRHTEGTLADSLKEGKITQEVMDLRWRMYKILKASDELNTDIIGYDDEGMPITKTKKLDKQKSLSKIKTDKFDKYPLIMVVDNTPIITSCNDVIDNNNIIIHDAIINYDSHGNITSSTHGEISGEQYFATTKSESPINITRENPSKFDLETYTKKLNVRKISETKSLLEFYVSQYPDEYNRTSRLFISDLKKAILEPRHSTILDIKTIGFISYKTIGVDDFLEFEYKVFNFDKIIEFDGCYVVKFVCDVVINGVNILETHRISDLDKKYENKEKKKQ